MKTYNQLKAIAEEFSKNATKIPCNPLLLCNRMQIAFKTKVQCSKDFGERHPLEVSPAILYKRGTLSHPDNIIYFDEASKYWQFYIFHELAHHILEHEGDAPEQEQEANMLACMLVAPPHLIPTYINSAINLSNIANIPIGRAEEYWQELHKSQRCQRLFALKYPIIIPLVGVIVAISIATSIAQHNKIYSHTKTNSPSAAATELTSQYITPAPYTTTLPWDNASEGIQRVYITPSGKKYHVANCHHISKSNVMGLSVDEAVALGKEPCKDCIN